MMSFKNSLGGGGLILIVLTCWFNAKSSEAFGTFGFDIHHRYSGTVKKFLDINGLPEKGTVDYYSAMARRDRHLKARRLAASTTTPILTFYGGNDTFLITSLGFLHYAFLTVGTPAVDFMVALDTSTDLFWIPCDCTNCARSFNTSSGTNLKLKIYSPSNSTTSTPLPCNSPICVKPQRGCSAGLNDCSYREVYGDTSTSGILVNDVLHLGTDISPQDAVDHQITFGCGKNITGAFLDTAGINGVFGLGMDNISVPSILANKGVTANSFSMCFGRDGQGRIEFGDKGSPLQKITPFNLQKSNAYYNITVTQVGVGNNATNLQFAAVFDTTSTFTYLSDPAYSFIVKNFNSRVTAARYQPSRGFFFDYCYAYGASESTYITPNLTFTMKGGSQFNVTAPTIELSGGKAYCLAIIKSEDINAIGQNYMEGYRLVFDREEMVLGWKESDCYDAVSTKNPPRRNSTGSSPPPPPPPPSDAASLSSMTSGLVAVILAIFFHHFTIISS
ncbi:hypothetical protein ACP275_14G193500 [Erythranthe tilingii]